MINYIFYSIILSWDLIIWIRISTHSVKSKNSGIGGIGIYSDISSGLITKSKNSGGAQAESGPAGENYQWYEPYLWTPYKGHDI